MSTQSAPRWLNALLRTLKEHEKDHVNVYQLATVDHVSRHPHVRSVIHREVLNSPPLSPSTPLFLITTDGRTPKVSQMPPGARTEICWWIDPTQEQFRISADAFIVRSPALSSSSAPTVPPALRERLDIDWEQKRRETYDTMSGHMKASWVRPIPGSKMERGYGQAKEWPETIKGKAGDQPEDAKEREDLEESLKNFALVVLDPVEVDYVELGVVPNQRTRFTREGGEWKEEVIVP